MIESWSLRLPMLRLSAIMLRFWKISSGLKRYAYCFSYPFKSYRVYERGIDLFGFPIAFDIWTLYLNTFVSRFGGEKLERTRELFESAVEKVPPKYAKSFYLMYAKHEEEFGLGI